MKTSVALCTYNGEKYLKEQIDSILNQTKKVDEIVVCDDGSTDGTFSILEEYAAKSPEI
ncbi:glycosyltransferase, partial [Bacillus subtilis]|uniref:glycosyltransferase n=1 Tax=Bacillus subtilis TaxID=1423 RepID=UPI003C165E40